MNPSLFNYLQTQRAFYKHGGKVKSQKANRNPSLAEMIRPYEKERNTNTGRRTDTVNKAKELSQRLIDDVLKSNNGKLDESALIQGFAAIDNNLNLNEEEKYQVERFVENIFKNYQFTTGLGYFYSQAHKNSNPVQSSFKVGGEVRVTSYLKNKFVPKERFFNETLDFLPEERFAIKPLVNKKGGLASFIV